MDLLRDTVLGYGKGIDWKTGEKVAVLIHDSGMQIDDSGIGMKNGATVFRIWYTVPPADLLTKKRERYQ
jgi:hypothetical protein